MQIIYTVIVLQPSRLVYYTIFYANLFCVCFQSELLFAFRPAKFSFSSSFPLIIILISLYKSCIMLFLENGTTEVFSV